MMEQRLINLFDIARLDSTDLHNLAEIRAYCSALGYVVNHLGDIESNTGLNMLCYPYKELFDRLFDGISIARQESGLVLRGYSLDTIGNLVAKWMPLFCDVYLDRDGKSWLQIDALNESWDLLDSRNLRWTMIESR